jgi:hypothetical protein
MESVVRPGKNKGHSEIAPNLDEENKNTAELKHYEHLEKYHYTNSMYSDEQARLISTILSQQDESLDIQGYGGVGKSHLITELCKAIPEKVLVTSLQGSKLKALMTRIPNFQGKAMTVGTLVNEALARNLLNYSRFSGPRTKASYQVSPQEISRMMHIPEINGVHPRQVINIGATTVRNFCFGTDDEISDKHLPKNLNFILGQRRDLILFAQDYWNQTIFPEEQFKALPLRTIHQIKWATINQVPISHEFQMLICDEAHDLPPSFIQYLDLLPQATLTFRDRYQSFGARAGITKRNQTIRKSNLGVSVRSGKGVSDLCNAVITKLPNMPFAPMQSSKKAHTQIIKTGHSEIPDETCAILVPDFWYAFIILSKLTASRSKVRMLNETWHGVRKLIGEAIALFNKETKTSTHYLLRGATSWIEARPSIPVEVSDTIESILQQGYSSSDLERALQSSSGYSYEGHYVLGRFEDAKNQEFSKVCFYNLNSNAPTSETQRAYMINQTYTALSRAKHKLWVPGEIENWIEDSFREVK